METVYTGAAESHAKALELARSLLTGVADVQVDRVRIHRDPLEDASKGWPFDRFPWTVDGLQAVAEPCS